MKFLLITPLVLILAACSSEQPEQVGSTERWYASEDVRYGQNVFIQNCAVCHGDQAQGLTKDWKQTLADGTYPAPPLNGSAHAWHHPLKILLRTIQNGGVPLGGTMPGFKDRLSQSEQLAAIAYFQSFWSDEIYQAWLKLDGLK
ncbi:MAG: cytochrome c [Thiomicrospira sp.]|uniref:c-type cytochrome n=1 Tax=Thiomicrospira sp. TaxID=935 RepID=UPI001A06FE61|nr:c-type cytochrome [Thiomicrospira sp.]MBE0494633.1 cytochrome c [Thiomicrospira sp.]